MKSTELKNRVLVADFVEPLLIKGLEERRFEVWYKPAISETEVASIAGQLTGIVVNTRTPVRKELLVKAPELKWIARLGSGLDIIDLPEAVERGIEVINTPEANANAVAEHILGMLLNLANNLCRAEGQMRSGRWLREENRGWELSGKTVGIIGFGNTGSAFAKLLEGFDCRILAYDKYKQHYSDGYRLVEEKVSLLEVLSQSDVVSLHLPLTTETKFLASEEFFSICKENAVFVNSSRGKIVETRALIKYLQSGHLKGACLDVFENEKPETWSEKDRTVFRILADQDNVVMSPHIAGWTFESKIKIAENVLKKLDIRKLNPID
jgi:D-3-phosphoglycerate dehydrogenase / 2-oxoglutarate reductase